MTGLEQLAVLAAGLGAGVLTSTVGVASLLSFPVLVAVGTHDPVGGDLALVNALVARYTAAGLGDVTLVTYPEARHEVFNETNRDEVEADVVGWIAQRLERLSR